MIQFRFPESRVLLFCREPVLGQVKTRLARAIGARRALDVYTNLLRRTLETVLNARICPFEIQLAGDASNRFFDPYRSSGIDFTTQHGEDLGQRMYRGARNNLCRCRSVLIIGADCPEITGHYLSAGLALMDDGADAVIGPAEDGGYVLIGLRDRAPVQLFEDIDWGTDRVCAQTIDRFDDLSMQWQSLPIMWDVDRLDDLHRLETLGTVQP